MDKNTPLILSIIGEPDSGKTRLILKLLPELKRKGHRVAVAKHCPHGFDLDIEGKDSYRFSQAGGEGIFLSSNENIALLRPGGALFNLKEKMQDYFSDFDIVLMEGYNNLSGIRKMQVIRSSTGQKALSYDEIIVYISDVALNTDRPVYNPDDISGIVSFIESLKKIN